MVTLSAPSSEVDTSSEVEVQLIRYLHGERKYDGLDALTAGIAQDCADARQILAGTPMLA